MPILWAEKADCGLEALKNRLFKKRKQAGTPRKSGCSCLFSFFILFFKVYKTVGSNFVKNRARRFISF